MNYYIQGSANRAEEIKAAFEKKGYSDKGFTFDVNDILFFTANNKHINVCPANGWLANIIKTHPNYKELELPVEPKFKVGDWITCVDDDGDTSTEMIEDFCGDKVRLIDCDGVFTLYPKSELKQYHLWSIQDAKDGDVLCTYECGEPKIVFIYKNGTDVFMYYCFYNIMYPRFDANNKPGCLAPKREDVKPATKEQRDLLFAKMKEEGYEWDERKKELRKIIEPKFKVGDGIKTGVTIDKIAEIDHATRRYYCESGRTISFENQDMWHLAPKPHYDIANFKPFDKVLVRDANNDIWVASMYGNYSTDDNWFICVGNDWRQCIPYNGDTKHLLGTSDMCPKEYINW